MLKFLSNPHKMVNAMAFFADQCPGSTKMKIFKLMYLADKEHLSLYGRPITGDRYVRMKWGPTPSSSYDMTKGSAPAKQMALFQSKLSISGNSVKALHSPDMKVFSRSDEKILKETVEKFGCHSAAHLSKLSHAESSWLKTSENETIDFELMFDDRAESRMTLKLLQDEQTSITQNRTRIRAPKQVAHAAK